MSNCTHGKGMEIEVSDPKPVGDGVETAKIDNDCVRVKRKTLEAGVLELYQRALELLGDLDSVDGAGSAGACEEESTESLSGRCHEGETDKLCDLLKSRVECPDFLEKLESAQMISLQNESEEGNSWDMVDESDIWEGGNIELDQEEYVLVRQEDIVEGIASFMAAYLFSFKQTKDLTPKQLQEALNKTFSTKMRKGKLRKAWEGSKVIYNVVSWGATAIGIYQNPTLFSAASSAFWNSCNIVSKLF